MKTRFVPLLILLFSGLADRSHSGSGPRSAAAAPAEPAAPNESQPPKQMTAQDRARLHQRDMRHCLDKKTNREIHRCTVKQRKH